MFSFSNLLSLFLKHSWIYQILSVSLVVCTFPNVVLIPLLTNIRMMRKTYNVFIWLSLLHSLKHVDSFFLIWKWGAVETKEKQKLRFIDYILRIHNSALTIPSLMLPSIDTLFHLLHGWENRFWEGHSLGTICLVWLYAGLIGGRVTTPVHIWVCSLSHLPFYPRVAL